jgi:hypothetical protein
MTPEERALLTQFLGDLSRTQGVAKDQEAAAMIDNAIRANLDSAYVLVQHALLADQALHQAQAQIAQLQDQLQQAPPQPQSSFLGGAGLGPSTGQPQSSWGQAAQQPPPQQQPFFGGGPFSGGGGGLGSFLRTAGTAAAGVAGGELLFSGLSGLFGGHGGGFGGGGGWGGGGFGGGPSVENVTINEYGDDDGGDDGYSGGDDYS